MMVSASVSNWQPLNTLPLFSDKLDSKLEDVRHQYNTLLSVQHRPHLLDEDMVTRILNVYTEQQHFLSIYKEQAIRWDNEVFNYDQQAALEYFNSQIHHIGCLLNQIFNLTKNLAGKTVEHVLARQLSLPNKTTRRIEIIRYFQQTKFMHLQKTFISTFFQTSN